MSRDEFSGSTTLYYQHPAYESVKTYDLSLVLDMSYF